METEIEILHHCFLLFQTASLVRQLITYSESERGAQRITFLAKNSYTISKNNRKEDMDKVELRVVGKDCKINSFYIV